MFVFERVFIAVNVSFVLGNGVVRNSDLEIPNTGGLLADTYGTGRMASGAFVFAFGWCFGEIMYR